MEVQIQNLQVATPMKWDVVRGRREQRMQMTGLDGSSWFAIAAPEGKRWKEKKRKAQLAYSTLCHDYHIKLAPDPTYVKKKK